MNNPNTDQARELRRARIVKVRPKASPDMMPKSKVEDDYVQPMVVNRSTMPYIEEQHHVMFCPACQSQYNDTMVAARILHVGYEDDPLRNFSALANLSCLGCGWNEIIPIAAAEKPAPEQMALLGKMQSIVIKKRYEEMRGMMPGSLSRIGIGNGYSGAQAARNMALNILKYGSSVADRVWGQYEEADSLHAQVKDAERYMENERLRNELASSMANQIARKVDDDILESLTKTAPPPPLILDKHDIQLRQEMLESAMKEGDYSKRRSLVQQVKEFFW